MRILLNNNLGILDTLENKIVPNDNIYDKKSNGEPIIYNIREINNQEYCDLCYKGQIVLDKPIAAVLSKIKDKSYLSISQQDEESLINQSKQNKQEESKEDNTNQTNSKSSIFINRIINAYSGLSAERYNELINEIDSKDKEKHIDQQSIFTTDNKDRQSIRKRNMLLTLSDEHRFIDTANLPNEATQEALQARKVVIAAKKIVKDHAPSYYLVIQDLNERYTDKDVNTLGVSPGFIYYNPQFVVQCSVQEIAFILCHEACHIMFRHHPRMRKRNYKLWNLAGDALINYGLCKEFKITPEKGNDYFEFPLGGIYYPLDDTNVITESFYEKLYQENKNNPTFNNQNNNNNQNKDSNDNSGNGSGDGDSNDSDDNNQSQSGSGKNSNKQNNKGQSSGKTTITIDGKEIDISNHDFTDIKEDSNSIEKSDDSLDRRIQDKIRTIAEKAHQQGHGDCYGLRYFKEDDQPEPVSWVEALEPYLTVGQNYDLNYNKAYKNKLTIATKFNVLYPGKVKLRQNLSGLLLAVDTSGSVTDEDYQRFYNQANYLLTKKKNSVKGTVCAWNDNVVKDAEFRTWEEFKEFKPVGHGGTNPKCIFPWAKEHNCKYLVIYTDGEFYSDLPEELAEGFPVVIWVLFNENYYRKFNPSFGIKCI